MTEYDNYMKEMPILFDEMKKTTKYKGKEREFEEDGIYSPKVYFQENRTRILQVYKETHRAWVPVLFANAENLDMKEDNANDVSNRTCDEWRKILGIKQGDPIRGIGYINLRKLPGGASCEKDDLQKFVESDSKYVELLLRQIRLCNADLIVCGGTFSILWDILPKPETWLDRIDRIHPDFDISSFLSCFKNNNDKSKTIKRYNDEAILSFWEAKYNNDILGDRNPLIVQIRHPCNMDSLYFLINYVFERYKKFKGRNPSS